MTDHDAATLMDTRTIDEGYAPTRLALDDGGHVAYRYLGGREPTVVFLCGYASDMSGTKARFLHRVCAEAGHAYLRFIPLDCPVRLIHGCRDDDVPWRTSFRLASRLQSSDVEVEIVVDGDHRLSRDVDLERLARTLRGVLGADGP